ncbi:MAG: amino acid ABC transporter permease [Trueperaceae bacterium]|nr:amino acid ABC transporter permease [Trueperaceae bacterium]
MASLVKFIRSIRPSNFVVLLAIPAVVYLFLSAENYQRSLEFIVPGIWWTVTVAIGAYFTSAVLGLLFAGLLSLKLGERTLLYFGLATLALVIISAFFFLRPTETYALIGSKEGRVAIIQGTPKRISDLVRLGKYEEDAESMSIRGVPDLERALELFATDEAISAAFLPLDAVPQGETVIWQKTFLSDTYWVPGVVFAVFASLLFLLVLAAWQSSMHPLAVFAELYIDLIRGVPMLVVILYIGFIVTGAIKDVTGLSLNMYTRGVLALSIGYSAYMAEIFRAGIEAIPKGQTEAARSLGLNGWQTARYIVLPQAIKIVIPPLGNEFIAMLKDTALLSVISVRETTQRMREFSSNTFLNFPPYNTAAVLYVILTLAASSLMKWIERKTDTAER